MFIQILNGRVLLQCVRWTHKNTLRLAIAFGILAAASAAKAETAPPELQSAVAIWMKRMHPEAIHVDMTHIFWKQGAERAAVFVDYETADGGNTVSRLGQVFQRDDLGWTPKDVPLSIFGNITNGHLESADLAIVETESLQPGDPNCCPSGHKSWRVTLNPVAPGSKFHYDSPKVNATSETNRTVLMDFADSAKMLITLNAIKHSCPNLEINQPGLDLVQGNYDFYNSALEHAPKDYLITHIPAAERDVSLNQISLLRQMTVTGISIEGFAKKANINPNDICSRIANPMDMSSSDLPLLNLRGNGFFRNGSGGKFPASTAGIQTFRVPTAREWSSDFLGLIDTGVLFPHMACYARFEGYSISQRRTFVCDGENQRLLSVWSTEVTPKSRADELTNSCTESNYASDPRCRLSVRIAPVFHLVTGFATNTFLAQKMQLGEPENDPTGAF